MIPMIADIFYPILTLTITALACFIQKKKKHLGALPPPGHLLDPLAAIVFGFAKNQCAHIFLYYPLETPGCNGLVLEVKFGDDSLVRKSKLYVDPTKFQVV